MTARIPRELDQPEDETSAPAPRLLPAEDDPEVEGDSPCVLVAEDDCHMRQLLVMALQRDGFEVTEARDGAELMAWFDELHLRSATGRPVDLIITDIRMPVLSGLEALAALRGHDWAIPVIVITAFGDEDTHLEALRLGAAAVFDKPFDLDNVRSAARHYVGLG